MADIIIVFLKLWCWWKWHEAALLQNDLGGEVKLMVVLKSIVCPIVPAINCCLNFGEDGFVTLALL